MVSYTMLGVMFHACLQPNSPLGGKWVDHGVYVCNHVGDIGKMCIMMSLSLDGAPSGETKTVSGHDLALCFW